MESLQTVLFVIQIIVSALLILIVLMQQSDEDSLSGIGGGASNKGLMPYKTITNTLTKITMTFFAIFMINSLLLATISARNIAKNKNLIERYIEQDERKSNINIPEIK
jgi:protein translocase SecG subunit